MPNQNNFRSDITTNTDSRFLASRIVKFPEEGILKETIPASFAFDSYDNIEVHFYTNPGNVLLLSTVIPISETDILKTHVVSYADGTLKNYIRIDFTKLFEKQQITVIPGDYRVAMNFFSDEIGSYYDRNLYVQVISESRTEVQLAFSNNTDEVTIEENKTAIHEFVTKSFDKPNAVGAAYKMFVTGVETGDNTEGITYDNIIPNIAIPDQRQTYDNTIRKIQRLSDDAESQFEKQINDFLVKLYETLRETLIIRGDRRIQEDEFQEFIKQSVEAKIQELQAAVDRRISLK